MKVEGRNATRYRESISVPRMNFSGNYPYVCIFVRKVGDKCKFLCWKLRENQPYKKLAAHATLSLVFYTMLAAKRTRVLELHTMLAAHATLSLELYTMLTAHATLPLELYTMLAAHATLPLELYTMLAAHATLPLELYTMLVVHATRSLEFYTMLGANATRSLKFYTMLAAHVTRSLEFYTMLAAHATRSLEFYTMLAAKSTRVLEFFHIPGFQTHHKASRTEPSSVFRWKGRGPSDEYKSVKRHVFQGRSTGQRGKKIHLSNHSIIGDTPRNSYLPECETAWPLRSHSRSFERL